MYERTTIMISRYSILVATFVAGPVWGDTTYPDVTDLVTIIMDTSQSTIVNHCGDESVFESMHDVLVELIDDDDALLRDGRLGLRVMYYGSRITSADVPDPLPPGGGVADCEDHTLSVVDWTPLTDTTFPTIRQAVVSATSPLGGGTLLARGIECAHDDLQDVVATGMFPNAESALLVVIAEGCNTNGPGPVQGARDEALYGGTAQFAHIVAVGIEEYFGHDVSDYLESYVIGPPDAILLPYDEPQFGADPDWQSAYAVSINACEDYAGFSQLAALMRLTTTVGVHWCPYDLTYDGKQDIQDLGVILAAFDTSDGDPFYNLDADLDQNGSVDQQDLGMMLAAFGCGTDDAP
jgi:hypothetical protein